MLMFIKLSYRCSDHFKCFIKHPAVFAQVPRHFPPLQIIKQIFLLIVLGANTPLKISLVDLAITQKLINTVTFSSI